MDKQSYTIKDPNGRSRELSGNPDLLTLEDVLEEVGKQGGERWGRDDMKIKVGVQTFGETDLHRTFSSIGVEPGTTIEVLGPVSA